MYYEVKPDEFRHVIHAVKNDFFDVSRLDGRNVLDEHSLSYTQMRQFPRLKNGGSFGKHVFIEEADGTKEKIGYVKRSGMVFRDSKDDEIFHGAIGIVPLDENKESISDVNDIGKLVVLENGDVTGVIASNGFFTQKEVKTPMTLAIPAVSFIVPPTENIKHYARANFNLESLIKGRKVLDGPERHYPDNLVYREGTDPSNYSELHFSHDSVYFGQQKYDGAWRMHSWVDSEENELEELYKRNVLTTTPDSIGQVLLVRGNPHKDDIPKEEIVAGIVVGHKAEYNEDHGRWYATTKVCPANRFTLAA